MSAIARDSEARVEKALPEGLKGCVHAQRLFDIVDVKLQVADVLLLSTELTWG